MLPNKMRISERATNSLRRLQNNTGLTVNIGARIAFFASIERGDHYDPEVDIVEHTGRELDKHTWLGSHVLLVEMLLTQQYHNFDNQNKAKAWAYHVSEGSSLIEGKNHMCNIL